MAVLVQVAHAWKSSLCGKARNDQRVRKTSFRDFQSPKAVLALFAASWSPEVVQKDRRWKSVNFFSPHLNWKHVRHRGSIGPFVKKRGRVSLQLEEKGCFPNC